MTNILLTGGSGFLGSAMLSDVFFADTITVGRNKPKGSNNFIKMALNKDCDFSFVMSGIDVVVHTAARAHVMNEKLKDPAKEYFEINTLVTLNLARQAIKSGVKRFIFISTIKVLGESTSLNKPFNITDEFNPFDSYAKSKTEAEKGLKKLTKNSDMELVIIRPPLVYGKGVKGNFSTLINLVKSGIPYPFPEIDNKRSIIAVENLVDLIKKCVTSPEARNQIFLASDDCDLSTFELIQKIAVTSGLKNKSFKIPITIFRNIFYFIGKIHTFDKLCSSMQVDISHTKKTLNWIPPISQNQALENCLR